MKTLWFKSCYVKPIIDGYKRDTIRAQRNTLPNAGDVVDFSVGPRTPFARARIVEVQPVTHDQLPPHRSAAVKCLYGNTSNLVKLTFELIALDLAPLAG